MAESYPISQIQIGDKTFEIVDAVARDSVSLIYKWGRPSLDPRASSAAGISDETYFIIAHLLPNENDRFLAHKSSYAANYFHDNEAAWKGSAPVTYTTTGTNTETCEGWNYPAKFNINDILENFSFAFGQLNLHSTGVSGGLNRNIRQFVSKIKKGKTENLDILNNYKLPDRQTVYEEWAWATFYTTRAGDVVTTNTFITSQKDDIMGTFGLTSTGTVRNIYGNATTIIFSHVNVSYNNLTPEETSEEESSNNNGS